MKALLLYPDREWTRPEMYFDEKNITRDLGLNLLYSVAGKKVLYENGQVRKVSDADGFITDVMHKVMMTPLGTEREIRYRQHVIADCIENEALIRSLYELSENMLLEWEKLGRYVNGRNAGRDNASKLITRVYEFRLFLGTLGSLRALLNEYRDKVQSEGLGSLCDRFTEEFPTEWEAELSELSSRIAFYVDDDATDDTRATIRVPRIVLGCGLGSDLRFQDFRLESIETINRKYRNPKGTISRIQGYLDSFTPDSVSCDATPQARKQTAALEYAVVKYIMSYTEPFLQAFENFFDALHFQTAFYVGAVNLIHHIHRFELDYCYPDVGTQDGLSFDNLKEFVMCLGQRITAVGNSCEMKHKMLIIVTGANQGGKSTFLRSIGIAQVMMQCGLMVVAERYESGIFPSLFMHFTRREDSQMNSGRLDEELRRMDQIIRNLGPDSLILLNESFATTTEKDGSEICYDIIRALTEAGVKILSVTHLLSFAQKIYAEASAREQEGTDSGVAFLSAERKEDGSRTYKMIQSVPELTSFGLDLYEKIIEEGNNG